MVAANLAEVKLFLGSYPITPASDILHQLSQYKNYGVVTFQAEDEIAAIASAIGASFGGSLGITTTSGPGIALKGEAMGLAVTTELPLVIVDVQRGGPSRPACRPKTEQADLLQVMYGRNGECPLPIVAASTPADCFRHGHRGLRASPWKYMTPVVLLTRRLSGAAGARAAVALADSREELPDMKQKFRTDPNGYHRVYERDPETMARAWVQARERRGLEHRIGGLEKDQLTGNVSYDPGNHEQMVRTRAAKVAHIANDIPLLEVEGPETGDLLVLSWGGTYGACTQATQQARSMGYKVASTHLRYLNPFPRNLEAVLRSYKKVLVPELNLGQLVQLVRGKFMVDAVGLNKIQGKPFKVSEIVAKIEEMMGAPTLRSVAKEVQA